MSITISVAETSCTHEASGNHFNWVKSCSALFTLMMIAVATEKCRYSIFYYYAFLGVLSTFKWAPYFEGEYGKWRRASLIDNRCLSRLVGSVGMGSTFCNWQIADTVIKVGPDWLAYLLLRFVDAGTPDDICSVTALWIHCGRPVRFIIHSCDVRISMERFSRTIRPPWFQLDVLQAQTCRFCNLCLPVKDFEVRNTRKIAILRRWQWTNRWKISSCGDKFSFV